MTIKNTKLGGSDYSTPTSRIRPTDLNDTNDALLQSSIGSAQNAYQILQANNVFDNKDFLMADEFTDSTGTNNTVNTTSTDSVFSTNSYDIKTIEGITGLSEATEYNIHTGGSLSFQIIHTYTPTSDKVWKIEYDYKCNSNSSSINGQTYVVFNYVGYSGATTTTLTYDYATYNNTYINDIVVLNPYPNRPISSISIYGHTIDAATDVYSYCKNFNETSAIYNSSSSVIIDSNTLMLDGTENAIAVYTDATNTSNTSIGVKVGDGTTQTSEYEMTSNKVIIPISALSSGTLELEFNLQTSDNSETPELKGFGCLLLK